MEHLKGKGTLYLAATLFFLAIAYPALANVPIMQGIFGSSGPFWIGILTRGFAFVAVIAIEAYVLKRFYELTWFESITAVCVMNLISSVLGLFIGGFSFTSSVAFIVLPVVSIICLIALFLKGMPFYYGGIIILTGIAGFAGVFWSYSLMPPAIPIEIIGALTVPLVLGFSLTLMFEGMVAQRWYNEWRMWKGILVANVCSYAFLMVLLLFVGPNPFTIDPSSFDLSFRKLLATDVEIETVIEAMHQRRASTWELIGLAENAPPQENYDAFYERWALPKHFKWVTNDADPGIALAIIDDTLAIETLTDDARESLEWMRIYFSHCVNTRDAILENDIDQVRQAHEDWKAWFEGNRSVSAETDQFIEPEMIVRILFGEMQSGFEITEQDEIIWTGG